jgi:hypothetical protein
MANFFVAGSPATRSPYKNTSSSSLPLHGLYTFWLFQKIAQKVLRCGSHQNGFPKPQLTPRRGFDLKFHRVCEY